MSVSIEDKVNMMKHLLSESITEESEKTLADLYFEYEIELTSAQKKVDEKVKRLLDETQTSTQQKNKAMLQKQRADEYKATMQRRQRYTKEILTLLHDRVKNMSEEKKEAYLRKSILEIQQSFSEETKLHFFAEHKDLKLCEKILKELKDSAELKAEYTLGEKDLSSLGGIIAENDDHSLRADYSVVYYLSQNAQKIGQFIKDALDEVVEVDG